MGAFYPQWKYVMRIEVTPPPATVGYQVKVTIPWMPGMKDDFSDLRFSDYRRTLPYWIEDVPSTTTRVSAVVWVKLTEVDQAAKEFFCYYGNGGAVSESNGDTVFELFDHFPGSSVDGTKWTSVSGVVVSNSVATLTNSGSGAYCANTTYWGAGYAARGYVRWDSITVPACVFGLVDNVGQHCLRWMSNQYTNVGSAQHMVYTGGDQWHTSDAGTSWHIMDTCRHSTTNQRFIQDGTLAWETNYTLTDTMKVDIEAAVQTGSKMYLDWVLVRKYQATEPICTPSQFGVNAAYYNIISLYAARMGAGLILIATLDGEHIDLSWSMS